MEDEADATWDEDITNDHLYDAGGYLMTRISGALHQVADSGLLEAGGIQEVELQRLCWCLYMGMRNVVRNSLACVSSRPHMPCINATPVTSRFHLCEAAQYMMIHMRDGLHHLARTGILEGAGMDSKDSQAFLQAVFQSVHVAIYNTAKLYEHC